ncbi:MAG TPA: IMP dehydrogenase [Ktedonobacteraceae bacterium]|nr:IMP dehydrogenase [Ktedonobacteraceae bacterium]
MKNLLPLGLTFDDILLLPGYTDFFRSDIDLSTQLTKHISIKMPLVSAPMDTVTESRLAIALAKLGGIGIIHRNLTIEDQVAEAVKVLAENLPVGVAIGASPGYEKRVDALVAGGVKLLVIDTAHGFAKYVIDALRAIKKNYPYIDVIAGSIATADGAQALIDAGADGLRVGMGPGAICTTRVISGMGVPQITALQSVVPLAAQAGIPVIADGGIKYSGDIVKALAVGANTVMMGSFFAAAEEAPGRTVILRKDQVPHRFRSIFQADKNEYLFKEYRGMGSVGAMKRGGEVHSEEEFHGKSYEDGALIAEGVEGLVPVKATVRSLVDQALGGIRSGMYYVGAKTITELWEKASFIQITQASLTESHPHDVLITDAGENY